MKRIALAALLLGACGSGGDVPPGLLGAWVFVNGTTGAGVRFDEGGTYREMELAQTSAGSADVQVTDGDYSVDGGKVSFTPRQSSCATAAPYSVGYSLSGGSLTLSTPRGTLVMVRDTSTGGTGATGVYGCFDTTAGTFTPRAVSPL